MVFYIAQCYTFAVHNATLLYYTKHLAMIQEDDQIKDNSKEELKEIQISDIDNSDIDNNRVYAALAYVIFFLPLILCGDSTFGKFHANQGFILFIGCVIVSIAGSVVPFIGWLLIRPIGSIAILIFAILGIINALKGEMKRLPIVGDIDIIK